MTKKLRSITQVYQDENKRLKEDLERSRRVGQIAMRDATRSHAFGEAVAFAGSAASAFLEAGMVTAAQTMLRTIRTAQIDNLRHLVSNEPGGIEHAKRAADTSSPAAGGDHG